MAVNQRTDIHRPGLIVPADYDYLFSFSSGKYGWNLALMQATITGLPQQEPVYGVDSCTGFIIIRSYRTVTSPWGRIPYFDKTSGSASGCDICGAHFTHGDVWRHRPSGEAVVIGHICADKMGMVANRGEWTRNQREMARMRKSAEYVQRRLEAKAATAAAATTFLSNHPGLAEALKADHHILRDLDGKLSTYGSLSPAQLDLAMRLAREVAEKAARATEPRADEILPPSGRVQLEGDVLSTKWVENDFGGQLKMLVQVTAADHGRFRVFGTAPAAILAAEKQGGLKGRRVRFAATVQPKETGFGFFSRPTSASLIPN